MSDIVLTRDRSSGRIHKRVRIGKGLASMEGCNLDQAGAYEILFELPPNPKLCKRCFAEPVSPLRRSDLLDDKPIPFVGDGDGSVEEGAPI